MRARRFPLHLRARFRQLGGDEWRAATTVDVSSSGVLLQASSLPPLDSTVEIRFALGTSGAELLQGEVAGEGRVVRRLTERDNGRFAVTFEQYAIRSIGRAAR